MKSDQDHDEIAPSSAQPKRDTVPEALRPLFEATHRIEQQVSQELGTVRAAILEFRSLVLEHYQRETERDDRQDRRLARIERHLGLEPLPDPTGPDEVATSPVSSAPDTAAE